MDIYEPLNAVEAAGHKELTVILADLNASSVEVTFKSEDKKEKIKHYNISLIYTLANIEILAWSETRKLNHKKHFLNGETVKIKRSIRTTHCLANKCDQMIREEKSREFYIGNSLIKNCINKKGIFFVYDIDSNPDWASLYADFSEINKVKLAISKRNMVIK